MQIKRFLPSLTGGTADLLFYFTGLYRLILKEKPTTGCLILMYHSLSRELKKLGYRYANTEKIFQRHLKFIRSHQIEAISLYEAISRIKNQEKFQDLCVAITFDDGWRDNYEIGYNLLRYYNIPATIFLIPNLVGYPSFPPCLGNPVLSERRVNLPRVMLNWEEIDKMKKDDLITFGSHTLTHHDLTKIPKDTARKEIVDSKKYLERKLNNSVSFFCYPGGNYNEETVMMVQEAGYKAAVTTIEKINKEGENLFKLGRINAAKYMLYPGSEKLSQLNFNVSYFVAETTGFRSLRRRQKERT